MKVRVLDMEFPVEVIREEADVWVAEVHGIPNCTCVTQGKDREHLKQMIEEAVSLCTVEVIDD